MWYIPIKDIHYHEEITTLEPIIKMPFQYPLYFSPIPKFLVILGT